MQIPTLERIKKMRNGEKIKCTRCEDGYFSAVGDPLTTNVFRCDSCQRAMVLTVAHKWISDYAAEEVKSCVEDIAIANKALVERKLPEGISGELICDVYCVPSHNHQTFYLQVYKEEQYVLLFAKPRIIDCQGDNIVMYTFGDSLNAADHDAKKGEIVCGMKRVALSDSTITKLIKLLTETDYIEDIMAEENIMFSLDVATTMIRAYTSDSANAKSMMYYTDAKRLNILDLQENDITFLNDLYLHIESIIGNLNDSNKN